MLDPYLAYLEQECQNGRKTLPPWTSADPALVEACRQYFPDIPLPSSEHLLKPNLTPVELLPLGGGSFDLSEDSEEYFVGVGGPGAAAVALEWARQGKPALYLSDLDCSASACSLPIWAGAGNHGEPDAFTEAPSYMQGYKPLSFIVDELVRFLFHREKPGEWLEADYPWLHLNFKEWLAHPEQWLQGLRIAWGSHCLAKDYLKQRQQGEDHTLWPLLRERVHQSGDYLEALQKTLGHFLREPRGSLLLVPTAKQWADLMRNNEELKAEGRALTVLSPEEAEKKYGFSPRHFIGLLEKSRDFIFEARFLPRMLQALEAQGGQVLSPYRLSRVFMDREKESGGILEFYEDKPGPEKRFYYRKFKEAHLSLGATPYSPRVYDLISVTGVSMNALLFGAKLQGGPIVCGGTNHAVPLLPPQTLRFPDPQSGEEKEQDVTFLRLSTGACVNPWNRGKKWYFYDNYLARHLLQRVQLNLPEEASLRILSVRGCNRLIGKDGRQIELHPGGFKSLTLQVGAGGGGLTQMGALPSTLGKKEG